MSTQGGTTFWLELLKAGDRAAVQPLWERYWRLLVSHARTRLGAAPRRAADEEDVALSAFDSFCRGVEKGRFPRLDDGDDLRRVLLLITARKAARLARRERAEKRGGGQVSAEADLPGAEAGAALAEVIGPEPTPELAASVAEECERLLDKLGDDLLRSIAVLRMEGHSVEEIAERVGRVPSTVYLKLALIRDIWNEEAPD
jgi:DNA-directed RNA polymerase specialized sigma24 family protein